MKNSYQTIGKNLFLAIIFMLLLSSCAKYVNSYSCPSIDNRYKKLNFHESQNLGRRKYNFKRPVPDADRKESYGSRKMPKSQEEDSDEW